MEQTFSTEMYRVAEIELVYKTTVKPQDRPQIKCSRDAFDLLLYSWDHNNIELAEQFKVLLLNITSRVLGIYLASAGGSSGTVVDPKLVFAAALKANAHRIILAHNHPSGCCNPSQADLHLTARLKEAGGLLNIEVADHIILAKDNFYSMADNGLL